MVGSTGQTSAPIQIPCEYSHLTTQQLRGHCTDRYSVRALPGRLVTYDLLRLSRSYDLPKLLCSWGVPLPAEIPPAMRRHCRLCALTKWRTALYSNARPDL